MGKALVLVFATAGIIVGCRGPTGPAGEDKIGIDIVPPTVELVEPSPFATLWNEIRLSAIAIDNSAIQEIHFSLDGSVVVLNRVLVKTTPPYSFSFNARIDSANGIARGWHFAQAIAYDIAGNVTSTPVVPFSLLNSKDMRDTTVTMAYHNPRLSSVWLLPDPGGALKYWVRFSPARDCFLTKIEATLGGVINDSAGVVIEIWKGETYPSQRDTMINVLGLNLTPDPNPVSIEFSEGGIEVERDFFVAFSLPDGGVEDTLKLAADGGIPPWKRSGRFDEHGWRYLTERSKRTDNFMVDCVVYYDAFP